MEENNTFLHIHRLGSGVKRSESVKEEEHLTQTSIGEEGVERNGLRGVKRSGLKWKQSNANPIHKH